jgi:4-hydroxy-tetrahydrodipicolinate synthase
MMPFTGMKSGMLPDRFTGSITALVTPFRNDSLDEEALRRHVERQIVEGTHGLVPVGTTGESPTLSHEEHKTVVAICVDQAKGRVPIIAGAGSNATDEAIDFAHHAEKTGADALLVVTPYYNKPSQEGMYRHFRAISESCGLPLILYNIPPRSVVDLSIDTMARLYELKTVIGVKDATANLARVALQRQKLGPDFLQLSGEDITAVGFNAMGGRGCISVSSNVAPSLCARLQEATLTGDYETALALQDRLTPLHNVMFSEPNPAPAKYGLSRLGLMQEDVRLPLVPMSEESKTAFRKVMMQLDLLAE